MTSKELKRARLKSKLSQEKAARLNNVSTSAWQSWELGRRKIPADFVLVLPKGKCEACDGFGGAASGGSCKVCKGTGELK